MNDSYKFFVKFVINGLIVIDEFEYIPQETDKYSEKAQNTQLILRKQYRYPILQDMASIFADEQIDATDGYRNTLFLPNLKAYARADGIKPENIMDMLISDKYYELSLGVSKKIFADYMNDFREQRLNAMYEFLNRIDKTDSVFSFVESDDDENMPTPDN